MSNRIFSSSTVPTPELQELPCNDVNIIIPTNQNSYARVDYASQTVEDDGLINASALVSDFTDGDYSFGSAGVINVREGVYLITWYVNASTGTAGNKISINVQNSREPIPVTYSVVDAVDSDVTSSGSYTIEFLEDSTISLQNTSGFSINVADAILNLTKLKNYGSGSTTMTP